MSTEPKATPKRKSAAKRGPTKAAALKALGLTQADLDRLKNADQKQADDKLENLRDQDPIPGADAQWVEEPVTPGEHTVEKPELKKSVVDEAFYVRNLRSVDVGFRLSRQSDKGQKRTNLRGRGQRGDMIRLMAGDLEDGELLLQVNYGLVEIITAAEAKAVIDKQSTNQQQVQHPAMAMLRNEKGQAYADDNVKLDPEFNSQGVTVAQLDPRIATGQISDTELKRGSGFQQNIAPGGNTGIISDGFARPDVAADAVARRNDIQGPGAGLPPGIKVTVDPVQRT